jgi:hypothetical protein
MNADVGGRPGGRTLAVGISTACVGALMIVVGLISGGGAAFGAGHGLNGASCLSELQGVSVHFLTAVGTPPRASVTGMVVDGFSSSSCDGQPVEIILRGNTAGDPAARATDLLSTLDSSRDSCTNATLEDPLVITGGAITLHGCAATTDPHHAAYADIHDLTRLVVKVNGHEISAHEGPPVTGNDPAQPPQGTGPHDGALPGSGPPATGSQAGDAPAGDPQTGALADDGAGQGGAGVLPFTGGPSEATLWLGLLLVLCGSMTLLARRRMSAVRWTRRRR